MAGVTIIWASLGEDSATVITRVGELQGAPGLEGNFSNSLMRPPRKSIVGPWFPRWAWLLTSLMVTEVVTGNSNSSSMQSQCMEGQGAGFPRLIIPWVGELSKFSFANPQRNRGMGSGNELWGGKRGRSGSAIWRLFCWKTHGLRI